MGDYPFEGVGWVFGYGDGVVDGEKVFGGTHDIYLFWNFWMNTRDGVNFQFEAINVHRLNDNTKQPD